MHDTLTVINVFDLEPSKQQPLVELLTEGAEQVVRHRPGFVALELLVSNDGTRVVNRARWRSLGDIKAAFEDPALQDYARRAGELARATPHVYSTAHRLSVSAAAAG